MNKNYFCLSFINDSSQPIGGPKASISLGKSFVLMKQVALGSYLLQISLKYSVVS